MDATATRRMQWVLLVMFILLQILIAMVFIVVVRQMNNGNRALVCVMQHPLPQRLGIAQQCLDDNGL